jgi:hypothetical protein
VVVQDDSVLFCHPSSFNKIVQACALSFGTGRRLERIVADMGKAFGMDVKKYKVNTVENNFLRASLGLIALMMVRHGPQGPIHFSTENIIRERWKGMRTKVNMGWSGLILPET